MQLIAGNIFEIEIFIVINVQNIPQCYAIGRYFKENNCSLLKGVKLDHVIFFYHKDECLGVVRAHEIKQKVIIVSLDSEKYIACIPPSDIKLLI